MKTVAQQNTDVIAVSAVRQKVQDYQQLIKTRLTALVVFSAAVTYATAAKGAINLVDLTILSIAGFLVVAASNGLYQIIEKNFDINHSNWMYI